MDSRQIALLRGVNVGRARRVAMADLRDLVEALGYRDVSTLLNSGNVVFTAGRRNASNAGARIEKALVERLGVQSRVFVLDAIELATAVAQNPFVSSKRDPARMLLAVTASAAAQAKLVALTKQPWTPDEIVARERVAYLWCAAGLIESKLAQAMSRALGDGVTTRNWATVLKLLALAQRV